MVSPTVSVVTATYNRSNVLRLTIEALRRSTFEAWELIVVGDACTDDTAEVLASFGDARIRFVNLEQNSGDQAAPNNHGVLLARGELVAFLNHDDLWTEDHLETAVAVLADGRADLVSTITIAIDPAGVPHLGGVCPRGVYEPQLTIPASSWVLRRELAQSVGPWRRARELYANPSQEWLFRAWRQRRRLLSIPRPTVVAVQSGGRRGSYAERQVSENAHYAALLRDDPEFIARTMASIAVRLAAEAADHGIGPAAKRLVKNVIRRAATSMSIHPLALRHAVVFRRKGGFIDSLRRTRGLPPLGEKE